MVKPNSKLRERIREATAEVILEAAEAVFAEEGLHAAKVESIAALAGVSVGTLYNHFGDRNGLITALLDERRRELNERLDATLEASLDKPFPTQVRMFVDALVGHFVAHGQFFSILMEAESQGASSHLKPRAMMKALKVKCATLVQRGLQSGALAPSQAEFGPALLMSTVRGVLMCSFHEKAELPANAADIASGFFLRGAGVLHG